MSINRPVSGEVVIKKLCKHFGFSISQRTGSHVRLSKETKEGEVGTVVPLHDEVSLRTLRGALQLGMVTLGELIVSLIQKKISIYP